jgi:hypothetical protein
VHTTAADHATAAAIIPATGTEFDGYATFLIPNKETLVAAYTDPHYLAAIKPDEDSFLDRSDGRIVIGYETVHIVKGNVV